MHRYRKRYILLELPDGYGSLSMSEFKECRMKVMRRNEGIMIVRTDNNSLPKVLQILRGSGIRSLKVSGTIKSFGITRKAKSNPTT